MTYETAAAFLFAALVAGSVFGLLAAIVKVRG